MTIDEARTWLQRHADNTPMPGAREAYKTILAELQRTRWVPVVEEKIRGMERRVEKLEHGCGPEHRPLS